MKLTCPVCDSNGYLIDYIPHYEHVTRDMAIDAGERDMEGQEICVGEEEVERPCEFCQGEGYVEDTDLAERALDGDMIARDFLNKYMPKGD